MAMVWIVIPICQSQTTAGYRFHHLTTAEGLSQASNAYVYRDSRGFVWISSIDGLNRFDGLEVRKYRPRKNDPKSIVGQLVNSNFFEDKNGNIWFCTYQAINRYNRQTDDFDSWLIVDRITKDTLREDYIAFYLDTQDQLWIQIGDNDRGQLYFFDITDYTYKKVGNLLGNRFIVDDKTNDEKESTVIYSFFYFRPSPLFRTEISIHGSLSSDAYFTNENSEIVINDLVLKRDTLWLAGNFGIACFIPEQNHWWEIPSTSNLKATAIEDLQNDHFAVSTSGQGLYFYNYKTDKFSANFQSDAGRNFSISGNKLNDIYFDETRTLWVSDWNAGLNYLHLDKPKVENLILSDLFPGPPAIIKSMLEDKDGNIWCATTGKGLVVFKKGRGIYQYGTSNGLPEVSIYQLFNNSEDVVFAATTEGIYWFDKTNRHFHKVNADDIDFNVIGWLGNLQSGTMIFHALQAYEIKKEISGEGYYLSRSDQLAALEGQYVDYWYKTSAGDLYCNVNSAKTIVIGYEGKIDTLDEQIQNLRACWESATDNIIWLATTYGLVKMNQVTKTYTLFDESNGLPNQYLYSVVPDTLGYLWLSSNLGIIRFNAKTNEVEHLNITDGIWSNEFYSNAWLSTSRDELWFGNLDVINIIDPTSFKKVKTKPQIQITDFLVNDQKWNGSSYIGETQNLVFKYQENTLSFKFNALEYSDPLHNQLWYRLDGYDTDNLWLEARNGAPGFARYSKIPPGHYTFQIRAANSDGIKTGQPYQLALTILKPFYFQVWFLVLMIILISASAYGIYRYRLAQHRKEWLLTQKTIESEMKALRAQMNPHFIFNCINSINAFILKNKLALASEYLNNFSHLIRQILDISAQETIPLEEEVEFLESYLKAEKLRLKEILHWKFMIDEKIDTFEILIPTMVLQPFVENAIWNGISPKNNPGKVLIQIKKNSNSLNCVVEDDGIGRVASKKMKQKLNPQHQSKGLRITTDRLSLYDQKNNTKSTWEIEDLQDGEGQAKGTRVVLNIGLP